VTTTKPATLQKVAGFGVFRDFQRGMIPVGRKHHCWSSFNPPGVTMQKTCLYLFLMFVLIGLAALFSLWTEIVV